MSLYCKIFLQTYACPNFLDNILYKRQQKN